MSTEHPSLGQVLAKHQRTVVYVPSRGTGEVLCSCELGKPPFDAFEVVSDATYLAHIERVWREACTIRTVETLDALPERSIVHEPHRDIAWMKDGRYTPTEPWWSTGSEVESPSTAIVLPVRLLHHPDWSTR